VRCCQISALAGDHLQGVRIELQAAGTELLDDQPPGIAHASEGQHSQSAMWEALTARWCRVFLGHQTLTQPQRGWAVITRRRGLEP